MEWIARDQLDADHGLPITQSLPRPTPLFSKSGPLQFFDDQKKAASDDFF